MVFNATLTMLQLYLGCQFYLWRKLDQTTNLLLPHYKHIYINVLTVVQM
jgi:hypothetical protein